MPTLDRTSGRLWRLLVPLCAAAVTLWTIAAVNTATQPLRAAAAPPAAAHAVDPTPVDILAVGDSNTAGAGGHPHLVDRLTAAGYAPTVVNVGIGGIGCIEITAKVTAWIQQHQPDYVLLSCGTNDKADAGFQQRYRTLVSTILAADPDVRVLWSWVGYSIVSPAWPNVPSWLELNEPAINDAIYRWYFMTAPLPDRHRVPAWADFQGIPPQYRSDGIHFTGAGHDIRQRLWFNALMTAEGRPDRAALPCGMPLYLRKDHPMYQIPAFTPCQTLPEGS